MNEILDHFQNNKRDLINLIFLLVLLIVLPFAFKLAKERQIFSPWANSNSVIQVVAPPNSDVKIENGIIKTSNPTIQLKITSPLENLTSDIGIVGTVYASEPGIGVSCQYNLASDWVLKSDGSIAADCGKVTERCDQIPISDEAADPTIAACFDRAISPSRNTIIGRVCNNNPDFPGKELGEVDQGGDSSHNRTACPGNTECRQYTDPTRFTPEGLHNGYRFDASCEIATTAMSLDHKIDLNADPSTSLLPFNWLNVTNVDHYTFVIFEGTYNNLDLTVHHPAAIDTNNCSSDPVFYSNKVHLNDLFVCQSNLHYDLQSPTYTYSIPKADFVSGKTYTWYVEAYDANNNLMARSPLSQITITGTVPAAPTVSSNTSISCGYLTYARYSNSSGKAIDTNNIQVSSSPISMNPSDGLVLIPYDSSDQQMASNNPNVKWTASGGNFTYQDSDWATWTAPSTNESQNYIVGYQIGGVDQPTCQATIQVATTGAITATSGNSGGLNTTTPVTTTTQTPVTSQEGSVSTSINDSNKMVTLCSTTNTLSLGQVRDYLTHATPPYTGSLDEVSVTNEYLKRVCPGSQFDCQQEPNNNPSIVSATPSINGTNYQWVANCSRLCLRNDPDNPTTNPNDPAACPKNYLDGNVNPATSNWCYGFKDGNRCMVLWSKPAYDAIKSSNGNPFNLGNPPGTNISNTVTTQVASTTDTWNPPSCDANNKFQGCSRDTNPACSDFGNPGFSSWSTDLYNKCNTICNSSNRDSSCTNGTVGKDQNITGILTDSCNNPIPSVNMVIYDGNNQTSKLAVTDANGKFSLDNFINKGDPYAVRVQSFDTTKYSAAEATLVNSSSYESQLFGTNNDCATSAETCKFILTNIQSCTPTTTNPSWHPTAVNNVQTTKRFRITDNLDNFTDRQALWRSYDPGGNPIDFTFANTTPGPKSLYVQFEDNNGQIIDNHGVPYTLNLILTPPATNITCQVNNNCGAN